MKPRSPGQAPPRARRKQDLLLASRLARGLAIGAFDELADPADVIADRVARVRLWLSGPWVWTASSVAGALFLGVGLRQVPRGRVLRWAWLAWRFWRFAGLTLRNERANRTVRCRTDVMHGGA